MSEVLACVIEREPDVSPLPAATPPAIRALINRCLTKDPRNRLQAIGEARIAIERAIAQPALLPVRRARNRRVHAATRLAAGIVLGSRRRAYPAGLVLWAPWRTVPPPVPLRLSTDLGVDASLAIGTGGTLALSPNGRVVVFVAQRVLMGRAALCAAARRAQRVAVDGAGRDRRCRESVLFAGWPADRVLCRRQAEEDLRDGRTPVTVCDAPIGDAPAGGGGAWAEDGTIVFVAPLGARHELVACVVGWREGRTAGVAR